MYQLSNFIDNDDIRTLAQLGPFQVIEYQRDLSVRPDRLFQQRYACAPAAGPL